MKRIPVLFTLFTLVWTSQVAPAQTTGGDERGIPFPSEHYAPPEYEQDPQNWGVAQDDRGIIYVANNHGVLEYDGERWRLIPTSTGSFVRSLAGDSTVYVGAKGDFGFLAPDSLGVLRYSSLYEKIPVEERDFEDIWNTHILDDDVYYQANNRLFRWDGSEIVSWQSQEGFHTSFVVEGRLYVRDYGRGLVRLDEDSLELVPNGEIFHETPIYMMVSHPSGKLLIGTQNKGLLLYDGKTFEPFGEHLTSYLQENDLYHGCRLPGNRYALATLGGGVIIVNDRGEVVRVLDSSSGLPDNWVNYVFADKEGQLWMALNSGGVFRADLNAPLSVHDERTGLEGIVEVIHKHRGRLYVATNSGLYILKRGKDQVLDEKSAAFEKVGLSPLVWDMVSVGEDLLAGTDEGGVHLINRPDSGSIADWSFTYDLLAATGEPRVYAATRSGLKGLVRSNEQWNSFAIGAVDREVRSVAQSQEDVLWVTSIDGVLTRTVLADGGREATTTIEYDSTAGLPTGYKTVEIVNDKVTVFSSEGFFQVANPDAPPGSWRFENRPSLLPAVVESENVTYTQDVWGNLWVAAAGHVHKGVRQSNGSYDWQNIRPLHFPKSDPLRMLTSRDSTVWLGSGRKLFRFAASEHREVRTATATFRPYIRQVTTLRDGDVVFGGVLAALGLDSTLTLPYGHDIRVDVAAPLYSTVEPHDYRYKLSGREDEWSDWTNDASERYRDLWEGSYELMVQARNDRGELSTVASMNLNVLPPWYRSLWAYLFYGVSFVMVAYGYRRYYEVKRENRRTRERVRKLEQERIVAERLKRANDRLREANRLKEDFLATTSHELRTPLTNILGSIDIVRNMASEEQEQFIDIIEKSGKRLKRTLNAILDLSMLRSGEEDVDLTPIAIDGCATAVASELKGRADEKDLSYWVDTPERPVYAAVDEQYLDQILRNLIENAIKFTDEGHVAVTVGATDGRAWIEVEDTGIGIDEEFLPKLFDEFKQESRGRARTYEGNGLGLAISTRLAEQMDGTIDVETTKGEGSTFTVEFPRAEPPEDDPEDEEEEMEATSAKRV